MLPPDQSIEMSSRRSGFRPAFRNPGGSPPKNVTFSDTKTIRYPNKADTNHGEPSKTWGQQIEGVAHEIQKEKSVKKRCGRKMPEARVRNARKHGELNFGPERNDNP